MRSMLRVLLASVGDTAVLETASGAGALQLLGLTGDAPGVEVDLILLDLVLPDADGIDIIRAIKVADRLQPVPILVVTAIHETPILKLAFEAGASDYITKPINEIELVARVGAALRLKSAIDQRKSRTILRLTTLDRVLKPYPTTEEALTGY